MSKTTITCLRHRASYTWGFVSFNFQMNCVHEFIPWTYCTSGEFKIMGRKKNNFDTNANLDRTILTCVCSWTNDAYETSKRWWMMILETPLDISQFVCRVHEIWGDFGGRHLNIRRIIRFQKTLLALLSQSRRYHSRIAVWLRDYPSTTLSEDCNSLHS